MVDMLRALTSGSEARLYPHTKTTGAPLEAAFDGNKQAGPLRRGRLLAIGALPPPVTGLSTAFQLFCEGIPSRGWEVCALDIADRSSARRNASFTWARSLSVLRVIAQAWWQMRRADVLYVTITHSVVGFLRDALLILGAYLFRVPIVVHHHGGAFHQFYERCPRWMRTIVRLTLERTSFIIALGESLRCEFAMVRGAEERVRVVPNTCTTPPSATRPPPSGTLRVLYLSNLMVEKGYLDVLDAASLMEQWLPGWKVEFHFAGKFHLGGDEFRTIEEMQADFRSRRSSVSPSTRIVFHGVVSGDEKAMLLRSAHVFVLPTYYRDEGQPISIIEALTSALPVIATAHRGIPELLPADMRPLIVPARDAAAIAAKLSLLALDADLYDRTARAALIRSCYFSIDAHLRALDEILAAAANGYVDPPKGHPA